MPKLRNLFFKILFFTKLEMDFAGGGGKVFRDGNPEYRSGYNKIDHYVEAKR